MSDCYACEVVPCSPGGALKLRLSGSAGLGYHNGGVGYKVNLPQAPRPSRGDPSAETAEAAPAETAQIHCNARMPPPPTPPPPPYCALRPTYVLTGRKDDDHGRNGRDPPLFEAEVRAS